MKKWMKRFCCSLLSLCVAASATGTGFAAQEQPKVGEPAYTWLDNDKKLEYPAQKTTAWASSVQSGSTAAANMLDGNTSTTWSAVWNNPPEVIDVTLTAQEVGGSGENPLDELADEHKHIRKPNRCF